MPERPARVILRIDADRFVETIRRATLRLDAFQRHWLLALVQHRVTHHRTETPERSAMHAAYARRRRARARRRRR